MIKMAEWLRGWIATWVIRIFEPDLYRALVSEFDLAKFETADAEVVEPPLDFDRYMAVLDLRTHEAPSAFAAWLHEAHGWDGDVRKIDP